MTSNSPEFWSQTATEFQQALVDQWSKALRSFQGLDLGLMGAGMNARKTVLPEIHFDPVKLQALQQQYLQAQSVQKG